MKPKLLKNLLSLLLLIGFFAFHANGQDCLDPLLDENGEYVGCNQCEANATINDYGNCTCPTATPIWNGTACVACPSGQVWNGSSCACPASTPSWNGTTCVACPSGSNWNGSACVTCPSGQVWNGSSCACPASTPAWNGTTCLACPSGSNWNGTTCITCPSGQSWNGSSCACPSGSNWNGVTCITCPSQQYWNGSLCVNYCPSNQIWNSSVGCVCPTGTHLSNGTTTCLACPIYTPIWDGSSCEACPSGTIWNGSSCATCQSLGKSLYNSICVTTCPAPQISVNGVCTTPCTDPSTHWDGTTCITCPADSIWNGYSCVAIQCPVGTTFDANSRFCNGEVWTCDENGENCGYDVYPPSNAGFPGDGVCNGSETPDNSVDCYCTTSITIINSQIMKKPCGASLGIVKFTVSALPPGGAIYSTDGVNWTSFNTTILILNLPVGQSTLLVKTGYTCNYTYKDIILEESTSPRPSINNVYVTRLGGCTGEVQIMALATTPPFSYSADDGLTWGNSSLISNLGYGSHRIRVRNGSGCEAVYANNPVVINNLNCVGVVTDASCPLPAINGSIELISLVPSKPYTVYYKKDGIAQTPFTGTSDASGKLTITGLSPANYTSIIAKQ